MKLAAIYNVWDGLEHLDKSISLIYPYVDHVILVWQSTSNFGEVNQDTAIAIQVMATKYPKVTHVFYQPNLQQGGTVNERNKRTLGHATAKELGCTHYIHMDTDEYYVPSDFEQGIKFVIDNNLDTSYCKLITYFKQPIYRLEPLESYYVPFICKITSGVGSFPSNVLVDPTRGASPSGRIMEVPIKMHHMSYVRKDIAMKLRNSSAKVNIRDMAKRLAEIDNWQFGQRHPFMPNYNIVECDNLFA
jgi:hypothetical protein